MTLPIVLMKRGDVRVGRPRELTMARALALSGGPDKSGWPEKELYILMQMLLPRLDFQRW